MSGTAPPGPQGRAALPVLAAAASLAVFAWLIARGLAETGGFEYPLDDPYIHLALAEGIAAGSYGINPGELAAPGSSALFPVLLLPFAGTALHRAMPLAWNLAGIALTAWLWGRLLWQAGYGRPGWRPLGLAAAVLGPIAALSPQVGYLGMEHTLHAAASLAVLLGLARHLTGQGGVALVLVGAFLASALRFEGPALGFTAALVLALTGRRGAGAAVAVLALLPVLAFSGFLLSLGLDPLPSSVNVKLAEAAPASGFVAQRLAVAAANLAQAPGLLLMALGTGTLALWRLAARRAPAEARHAAGLAAAVLLPVAAHLLVGRIGWASRYEHYVLTLALAGLLALLPLALPRPDWRAGAALALALGAVLATYQPNASLRLAAFSRAIASQQGQMARLAKDFWQDDVAVNDIGLISWQNASYVLDLWGLASPEARVARLEGGHPGWAGEMAAAQGVDFAMVYDKWIDEGLGADWVKIGEFWLTRSGGFLGDYHVSFYATSPGAIDRVAAAVAAWVPTLRPDTRFDWAPGLAPEGGQ